MLSELWMARRAFAPGSGSKAAKMQIDLLLDQLSMRLSQLELLHRRCIADARRHKASGMRALFRERMLEHRQLQAQQLQLQRYRQAALAQLNAVSNHEINQTFLRAMKSSGVGLNEVKNAMNDMHETVSSVHELSALLGEPVGTSLADEVVDDEELELEFAEQQQAVGSSSSTVAAATPALLPSVPQAVAVDDQRPAVETRMQPLLLRTTVFGV
jgi:hypothetical protein